MAPRATAALACCLALASCRGCEAPEHSPAQRPAADGGDEVASGQGAAAPDDAAASPHGSTVTVAVVSDLNGAYGSTAYGEAVTAAVDRLAATRPDLVICTGDMVAGQRAGLDYGAMWAAFHAAVTEPLAAAGIPLAVTPGNHDGSGYARYAEERAVFVREWRARRPDLDWVDAGGYPERYAFDLGPARFVALDASTPEPQGGDALAWLGARLGEGRDRPARIVFGHLPLRPLTRGREEEVLTDPTLERVLVEGRADAYLSGHHHGYFPGRLGPLRLIGVGCLGSGARPLLGTEEPAPRSFVVLRVGASGLESVEAYAAPSFEAEIPRSSLPSRVGDLARDGP